MDKAGAQPLASDASEGFVECQSQYWSSLRHPVHPHFLVCKIFSFRNQDAYEDSMMYVHCTLYIIQAKVLLYHLPLFYHLSTMCQSNFVG